MAKPLNERLASALARDSARDTDLSSLIAEAGEARQRHLAAAEAADAEAYDLALGADDRDAAAARADRARREVRVYEEAIAGLEQRLAERRATAKRQEAEAARAEVIAERDEIAARFAEVVPRCVAELTAIFAEVDANTARMRAAKVPGPNAESVARGVPLSGFVGNAEVSQFVRMRIPRWSDSGRCWPLNEDPSPLDNWDEKERQQRRQVRERVAADEAARFGWFRLRSRGWSAVPFDAVVVLPERGVTGNTKRRTIYKGTWSGCLARAEADRLREQRVEVEEIDRATAEAEQREREAAE